MSDAPHTRRAIAESFGDDAERYDRTRPRYPRALAAAVLDGLPGLRVLDVGIGTGISALALRDAGASVSGVEVDARMAALAEGRGFGVDVARFEDWDPGERRFDAVVAGQTWHWIDPAACARKAADVLVPHGRIALFWNVADPEPAVAAAFADVYRSVDTGLPFTPFAAPASRGERRLLDPAAAGIRATARFTEPEEDRFAWHADVTTEAWVDQVPTFGGHSRIPEARLAELIDGLRQVVDAHGGSFRMDYTATLLTAQRC